MNHENMGFSSTSLRSCWKPTHTKQRIHNAYIETSKVSVSKVLAVQKLSGINRKGAVMWQCIGQGVHLLHWQVVKLQDRTLLRLIADAKVVFCLDSLYGRGGFDGFMDSNIRQKPKKIYCMLNFQGVILCQLWVRGLTERGWGQEWITPQRHINHRVHYLSVQGRSSVRKKQYLTTMTHQTKKT